MTATEVEKQVRMSRREEVRRLIQKLERTAEMASDYYKQMGTNESN